ncbi:MAG: DUF4407 domain-containing protein [Verrucomicrobiales bacterium]|nr:DUF4407 domain-containing protein [Verrucomicrobiales bacterium]
MKPHENRRITNHVQSFELLFAWLAGTGLTTLRKCPDWEIRRHSVFGATILVPTLFGAAASGYAASTLTANTTLIVSIAVCWALIILTIDRAFLAAYRPGLPPAQKRSQFLLRFAIALLMGMTVAHPLVLLIFEGGIAGEIRSEESRRQEEAGQMAKTKAAEINKQIAVLRGQQAELRQEYQNSFDAFTVESPTDDDNAASDWMQKVAVFDGQISSLNTQKLQLQTELENWQTTYRDEIEGRGNSATPGIGPEARRIQSDEINWRQNKLDEIHVSIKEITVLKNRVLAESNNNPEQKRLLSAQAQAQIAELEAQEQSRSFLRENLQHRISALSNEIAAQEADKERLPTMIQPVPLPADLITRTLALHRLFAKEGGHFALLAYIVLSLVFVIMDTIPVVVKFSTKPGPYDMLVEHQEENFIPDIAESGEKVPEQSPPLKRTRIKYNSGNPRNRISDAWNRKRLNHPQPRNTTVKPCKDSDTIADEDHVMTKAEKLASMRPVFKTNLELSEAVGITPTTLSKYFKLMKLPQHMQREFAAVVELSLDTAYRIACTEPKYHSHLIALCQSGAGQKDIRNAITDLKVS